VAAGCGGRASDAAEIRETRVVDVHVHGDQADVVLEHRIGGTPIRATGHAVREHGRWVVADTGKAATAGRLRVYRVPSEAMEPTIKVGTTVLIDTTRYRAAAPALGDIVTFHPPKGAEIPRCPVHRPGAPCAKEAPQPESVAFIKRIVAGPGDRVAIRAGHVVRNGRTLDEPYTRRCADGTGCDFPKAITVPPDHYYLLGDDRGNSDDSRFWGPVPRRWIIGKVVRQLH
jgi:signal peptidase I